MMGTEPSRSSGSVVLEVVDVATEVLGEDPRGVLADGVVLVRPVDRDEHIRGQHVVARGGQVTRFETLPTGVEGGLVEATVGVLVVEEHVACGQGLHEVLRLHVLVVEPLQSELAGGAVGRSAHGGMVNNDGQRPVITSGTGATTIDQEFKGHDRPLRDLVIARALAVGPQLLHELDELSLTADVDEAGDEATGRLECHPVLSAVEVAGVPHFTEEFNPAIGVERERLQHSVDVLLGHLGVQEDRLGEEREHTRRVLHQLHLALFFVMPVRQSLKPEETNLQGLSLEHLIERLLVPLGLFRGQERLDGGLFEQMIGVHTTSTLGQISLQSNTPL